MLRERDKFIIRVRSDCGIRLDELQRLGPGDIVRSGRQAFLRVLGKRSRVRDVPVMPPLLRRRERLAEGRPEDRTADRLFIAHRRNPQGLYEPLTDSGIYKVVVDPADLSRMDKNVHPHLLRHSG